ncbi:MAG: DUF1992 domain-containing protein [Aggregatilineales bacterium]
MLTLIDEIIQEAMRKGEFANLPGAGKPLSLEPDPHTPDHLKLAHKLLKDNDLAPDWIEQGKAVDARRAAFEERLRRATWRYHGALNDGARAVDPERARRDIEAAWRRECEGLRAEAEAIDRLALSFNLKAPPGVAHKPFIAFERKLLMLSS